MEGTPEMYFEAMRISLEKKLVILKGLMEATDMQTAILNEELFDEEAFAAQVDAKAASIEELAKLDEGFEITYERIKEILATDKDSYKTQILELQERIAAVTEIGVKLEAAERRNKDRFDLHVRNSRDKIKSFNKSNAAVSQYYKNMNNQVMGNSYFLDKKK